MPLETNIREEVQHYLENADDRMLKIVHAILDADAEEDFWNGGNHRGICDGIHGPRVRARRDGRFGAGKPRLRAAHLHGW